MRSVFLGTPPFAAKTLSYLLEKGVEVVGVVTQPPRPKRRSKKPVPSPVEEVAREHGIPIIDLKALDELAALEAELFIVVAYGEILRQNVLDIPKIACINVHPSLLPKYRGAAPIQRAMMEGEGKTGVTIMHVVRALDAGDIILVEKTPIDPNETFAELEARLCDIGKRLLVEAIKQLEAGTAPRIPQDESLVTYAAKIETSDCQIDWSWPASQIKNLINAVSPRPGAWCFVEVHGEKKRLKILRAQVGEGPFSVPCGEGSVELQEVQLEGKKALPAQELFRGISFDQLIF